MGVVRVSPALKTLMGITSRRGTEAPPPTVLNDTNQVQLLFILDVFSGHLSCLRRLRSPIVGNNYCNVTGGQRDELLPSFLASYFKHYLKLWKFPLVFGVVLPLQIVSGALWLTGVFVSIISLFRGGRHEPVEENMHGHIYEARRQLHDDTPATWLFK